MISRRDFKGYDEKLKEWMDPAGPMPPPGAVNKPEQEPVHENRTGFLGLDHAPEMEKGSQNVAPRNVELHVDSKTFVTTTATLLASPEGCWFRHMISNFPNAQEFYVDRSPVRAVIRMDSYPRAHR